jgi:transposase
MQGVVGFTQIGGPKYDGHDVFYKLALKEDRIKCPKCGSTHVKRRGTVERVKRAIPIGHKKHVFFIVTIPRVFCPVCNIIRQVDISWFSLPNKSYTNAFAREVIFRAKASSPLSKVAETLDIDWHTANTILQEYLAKKYTHIDLSGLKYLAIDEIAIAKGHTYLTVVMNLETGIVVHIGDGKGESALVEFWEKLGKRRHNIKAVALDMSPAYTKAVKEHLPNAIIVYDRFHVQQLANKTVNALRRYCFRIATAVEKAALKGVKFIVLKNEENLDPTKNEKERLDKVLALNTPLTHAYVLKEALRQIWNKSSLTQATKSLKGWVKAVQDTKIKELMKLGKTIEKHNEGILNYYKYMITSGPIEGLNNKIKAMKRRAYGYRNLVHFKRMIYAIHEFDPRTLLAS